MSNERGFSLIELLIVVAIILIIAAIAIPNMMAARIHANETAAVSSIRTVITAQTTYDIQYGTYADAMEKLGGNPATANINAAGLVDWLLGCPAQPCTRNGFDFVIANTQMAGGKVVGYDVFATPQSQATGKRSFCGTQELVVSVDDFANNPPVCTRPLQ